MLRSPRKRRGSTTDRIRCPMRNEAARHYDERALGALGRGAQSSFSSDRRLGLTAYQTHLGQIIAARQEITELRRQLARDETARFGTLVEEEVACADALDVEEDFVVAGGAHPIAGTVLPHAFAEAAELGDGAIRMLEELHEVIAIGCAALRLDDLERIESVAPLFQGGDRLHHPVGHD